MHGGTELRRCARLFVANDLGGEQLSTPHSYKTSDTRFFERTALAEEMLAKVEA